jgi:outer membrane receptor protein involved in Fe transport
MKWIFFLSIIHASFLYTNGLSQISGTVFGNDGFGTIETLVGAQLRLKASRIFTLTNSQGKFSLPGPNQLPDTLVVSFVGYHEEILVIQENNPLQLEITLFSANVTNEVLVEAIRKSSTIQKMNPLHVKDLSENEFRKAACCSISEAFETNAAVDVSVSDPITGQRRIQMLGLDGIYTQINLENIPYFRGLSYAYGMSSIPGTWAHSLQITKGTGSVVHGYESMAGMINIELKSAEQHDLLFVNGYANIFGRAELNIQTARFLDRSKKWSSALFVHGSGFFSEIDNNEDGFRDFPLGKTLSALNRWSYNGEKFEMKAILSGHYDSKVGGQLGFNPRVKEELFGSQIDNRDLEALIKMGFFMANKPSASIAILAKGKIYSNQTIAGNNFYQGKENRFYLNSIYSDALGCTSRKIQSGLSIVVADFNERFENQNLPPKSFSRLEIVPGAFSEFTWTEKQFNLMIGVRGDYHNLFGFIPAPRLHLKFSPTKRTDLRFSTGRAWRVPNFVSDNTNLLSTNRIWVNAANLEPEISWNIGVSVVQSFNLFQAPSSLSLDYFHTRFEKQLIVDLEDQHFVFFYNLQGLSYSNAFQAELHTEPLERLELRLIYKLTDVKTTFGGVFQQRMMIPVHRGLINLGYMTKDKLWEFDFTTSVMGMMRLTHIHLPNGLTEPEKTEVFALVNAQITRNFKNWDFYLGGENLTNHIQRNAIVGADDPFGTTFDATRIYAPISGINFYLGLRYRILRK